MSTSIAERMAMQCYGKSADPAAPENHGSVEFQAGHGVGMDSSEKHKGMARVDREQALRKFPDYESPEMAALCEWTRGYWAGLFTRIENESRIKGVA